MTDQAMDAAHGPPPDYHEALSIFHQHLNDFWLGCGRPSKSGDLVKKTGLSRSTICDAMFGNRLPSLETLLAIVRALNLIANRREDEHVPLWRSRWEDVARLREEYRREHGNLKPPQESGPSWTASSDALPPTATLPELEAAQAKVQDCLSEIEQQEAAASQELLAESDARDAIEAEVNRLRTLLQQERNDKEELRRKVADLEQRLKKGNQHISRLRQKLSRLREDKLTLTQEESELNDRRADLYFSWARSEEVKNATMARQMAQRIAELADYKNRLEAADQLIASLRPPRAL